MITIYKTNFKVNRSAYVLCFSFSEDLYKRMAVLVDEQVDKESFHGRFKIQNDQRRALYLEKMPYDEAMNSIESYILQINPPICNIGIEHTKVEKKISFDDSMTIILKAKASEIALNRNLKFMIAKDEYLYLKKWDLWNEDDKFTSRYSYTFSPTSIGHVIKVRETLTKKQIDISNYDNW
jgi:hypothetical protein